MVSHELHNQVWDYFVSQNMESSTAAACVGLTPSTAKQAGLQGERRGVEREKHPFPFQVQDCPQPTSLDQRGQQ